MKTSNLVTFLLSHNFQLYFCLVKTYKSVLFFVPTFELIIWFMKSPKNFEKVAILKTIFEFDSDNGISLDHGSSLCVITLVRQPSVD